MASLHGTETLISWATAPLPRSSIRLLDSKHVLALALFCWCAEALSVQVHSHAWRRGA